MADDFLIEVTRRRYADLEARKMQEAANFAQAKANSDTASAEEAADNYAEYEARQRNLAYSLAVQTQQPPQAPEPTQEERAARPWYASTWDDTWEAASKSKYGCDPEAFKAGIAEVNRRRARGE